MSGISQRNSTRRKLEQIARQKLEKKVDSDALLLIEKHSLTSRMMGPTDRHLYSAWFRDTSRADITTSARVFNGVGSPHPWRPAVGAR